MSGVRHNISAGIASTGVNIIGQLALVPLYITMWGEHRYGEWLVLFSVPSMLALAELGLNGAFANAFVIAVEGREDEVAARMASSVWWFELSVLAVLVAMLGFAASVFPIARWMNLNGLEHHEFVWCIVALAFYSAASVLGGFFSGFYRAADRNAAYVNETTFFRVIELGGLTLVLLVGGSAVSASATIAVVKLSQVAWLAWRSVRHVPACRLRISLFSFREVKRLAPSGLAFVGYSFGNVLINQGAIVAVQQSLGSVAVVHFNVARQLGRVFLQVIGLLFSSVHPEMNVAFARRNFTRMARLQSDALTPLLWAIPVVVVLVFLFGPWVVALWTHGRVSLTPLTTALFSADALTYGLSGTALLAAWSSNCHIRASVTFLLLQAGALGLGIWGLKSFGIEGIVICFCGANVIQTVFAVHVSAGIVGMRSGELWASAVCNRSIAGRFFPQREKL